MMNGPGTAALNCPTDCWWINTRDQKVQIAQKVVVITNEEDGCCNLQLNKILPATSDNVQLEYTFYSLGKRVQA